MKMKYMKQFAIILAVSFIGEVLHALIPLPVPASIYGLILMLAGLQGKIIPLESVKDAANFLIEAMPLMFIPAAVGLLDSWGSVQAIFVQILVITVISTIVVMAVSGRATQAVLRWERRRKN